MSAIISFWLNHNTKTIKNAPAINFKSVIDALNDPMVGGQQAATSFKSELKETIEKEVREEKKPWIGKKTRTPSSHFIVTQLGLSYCTFIYTIKYSIMFLILSFIYFRCGLRNWEIDQLTKLVTNDGP